MPALPVLTDLAGKWQGTSQLWLSPADPAHESESTAEIHTIAQGQFTEIRYTWAFEGIPQEGRIYLGQASASDPVKAVWFDTWHMANQFMVCEGENDDHGAVRVTGSYSAPPGPDWGWQITLESGEKDTFTLWMHNLSPAGESFLAVKAAYTRVSGAVTI